MKSGAVLCLACVLTGLLPIAAQSCDGEVAANSADEAGIYVVQVPAAEQNSAGAAANMSVAPDAAANATIPGTASPVPVVDKADVEQAAPPPAASNVEDATAKADAGLQTEPRPALPSAALPAPWKVAQATSGTTPAQTTTDAEPAKPKKAASATKPRRSKKTAADHQDHEDHQDHRPAQRSGAAIVKEGGKTCSGLDQYRVCW